MDAKYFAASEARECAAVLMKKIDSWMNTIETNGYLNKLRDTWAAYHGCYYDDTGHKITFSGSEGELVNISCNHLRNLCQHTLIMVTSARPAMEARATNTDYKSLTQTLLANGLLDYYMREKHVEDVLKRAVEMAIVLASGFIKIDWNATSGEVYEINEETGTPIYEGDMKFTNLSPLDVVMDSHKENQDHDWIIVRTWKNRFDLAARYPELRDKILAQETKASMLRYSLSFDSFDETDDIATYEMFHRKSESVTDGRYMLFLSDDCILYDGPLPYRTIPIYRIAPSDILGTCYGYTNAFDLLPLQQAMNTMYSTALTNISAFGVQSILVPRGADVQVSQLSGGMNLIEANVIQGFKPEPLQLTKTPAEVYQFADTLRKEMETISGVNSVARGDPGASLESGAALALVQSQAIQFMSGLQASYVRLIEDVGSAMIQMLRDFAAVPRVAAIVGKGNRTYMREFTGDDLSSVNRVIVDVGNSLARTTAGRVQMAQDMLKMEAIKDPNQYFTVINTGKLDVMFDGTQSELLLIKGENERMMDGKAVQAIAYDDHKTHILEHKTVLADPDLRDDPVLVQNVLAHIQEHMNLWRSTDPAILMALSQQPVAPAGPPMAPGGGGPQGGGAGPAGPVPAGDPGAGGPPPPPGVEPLGAAPQPGDPGMPEMPKPPPPFENLPTNPNQQAPST